MNNNYVFDCSKCSNRCDGKSKLNYNFQNDVEYSECKEKQIIDLINNIDGFIARKCEKEGFPDIEVSQLKDGKLFYIEIKAQRRTFMSVAKLLPVSNLSPSETLALNLSDLLRYFNIRENIGAKIYILWFLENRPCIVNNSDYKCFYQDVDILNNIYDQYKDARRFRRESGKGDVVNGQHKGVVVNYHFSLAELKELNLKSLLLEGFNN